MRIAGFLAAVAISDPSTIVSLLEDLVGLEYRSISVCKYWIFYFSLGLLGSNV
jgi:hypothetical protein